MYKETGFRKGDIYVYRCKNIKQQQCTGTDASGVSMIFWGRDRLKKNGDSITLGAEA